MKKANLKGIMKRAWEIKREHKDNIFSLCLKMAWAEAKAAVETAVKVPSWFIGKKTGGIRPVAATVKGFVKRETAKAVLIDVECFGELWCPKSILK